MDARPAAPSDAAAVVATITNAFHDDPMWSWAFPDPEQRPQQFEVWWRLAVDGALPHGWVWVTDHCEAVAVWLPPGQPELSPDDEARVEPMLGELLGAHADAVLEAIDLFDAEHPHDVPHYYLSLVGTHADHRGGGIGVALLERCLALIDAEHMPAYLESTNPANLKRYQRLGFEVSGEFMVPAGGPTVTKMWRPAR